MTRLNIDHVRQDFPILHETVKGKPLAYLDSAATAQKPQCVLDTVNTFYEQTNSNIHRSAHRLADLATEQFEAAREKVRRFINAKNSQEIIFTSGTTASINLVANSFSERYLKSGDEVIISTMEHHANIVPWQLLQKRIGIKLQVIPINTQGEILLDAYEQLFSARTKLVSVTHISNALGTINPVKKMIDIAHDHNVPIMLDAAQSIVHETIDVTELDCDFLAFSAHKLYGPTGVGVIYGKADYLNAMPPYQGGGEMILKVSFAKTTFNELPYKFEAGTPNIAGVIGFGAAIDYINTLGLDNIKQHELALLTYATAKLTDIKGLRIIGEAKHKAPVISFLVDDIHAHDLSSILDDHGVATRAGHHCAMPVMDFFGIPATLRASFGLYTNQQDIDQLIEGLQYAKEIFKL